MWAWILLLGEKGSDSSDNGSHWLSDLFPDLSVDGRRLERRGGRSLLQTMKIHCTLWAYMALFFFSIISSDLGVERKKEESGEHDLPLAFPLQKSLQCHVNLTLWLCAMRFLVAKLWSVNTDLLFLSIWWCVLFDECKYRTHFKYFVYKKYVLYICI